MQLFQHQSDAIKFALERDARVAFFHEAGCGKTLTAIKLFEALRITNPKLRMLVVCPIRLIDDAWGEDIQNFTPNLSYKNLRKLKKRDDMREDILICNYEWLKSRHQKPDFQRMLGKDEWMITLDECFHGDTLVETDCGQKKIKDIKTGMRVKNCLGFCEVLNVTSKIVMRQVEIYYNKKKILCSENHPFLTDRGWVKASELKINDMLIGVDYAINIMRNMQDRVHTNGKGSACQRQTILQIQEGEAFLFEILFGEMESNATLYDGEFAFQRDEEEGRQRRRAVLERSNSVCAFAKETQPTNGISQESCEVVNHQKKNIRNFKIYELEAICSGRKWSRSYSPARKTSESTFKGLVGRALCFFRKKKSRISYALQNRHCKPILNDWRGSGRIVAPKQKASRPEEGQYAKFFRVENIKIQESGHPTESEKNRFYDLEVSGHPSFTVNGALVHNSQAMKNHKSKTTKCLLSVAYRFKHRIVMSGTPSPNDESEYWSQVAFISTEIFHKNFYAFRNTFFHLQRGNTIMPSGPCSKGAMAEIMKQGFKYALTDENRARIIERLERVCHFRQKVDCLDLPDMLDRTIHIDMDPEQRRHYNQMKYYSITQIREAGESIVARIALTKLMKLRQITSGFSIDEVGDVQELGKNPKLDMLGEVLEEIGDKQVIIWCNFRHEIQTLMRVLGDRARSLYGGVDEEYKSEAVAGFKAGAFQYLVAHPQSAGVGLTFVNCHNQIFYSLSYSFEDYEQCRARTHRAGQKNPCLYYHLICTNSIDETILNALKTKQSADQLVKDLLK